MKYFSLAIIVMLAVIWGYGCDSVTDSKPVSTTPPTLTAPPDNDTNVALLPVFTWTGNADKLEISTISNFETIFHSATVTGNQYVYPGTPALESGKYYYWRAGVSAGSTVYWSTSYFTFRTQ
jgi:hypothetical protein